jgi:hypothetical protein
MESIEIKKSKFLIFKERFLKEFLSKEKYSAIREKYSELCSVRIWIIIISFIGFFYQSWETTEEYLEYRTISVTKTKYELKKFTEIPAISFCSDVFFDLEKLKKLFPNIENVAQEKNILEQNNSDSRSSSFRRIYKFLDKEIENFSLIKAFNYSINFEDYFNDCNINNGTKTRNCRSYGISIETFQENMKCETYLTHLNNNAIKMKNIPTYISSIGWIKILMKLSTSFLDSNSGLFTFFL